MAQHYALANPISRLLDKDCEDFVRADLLRVIAEKQIEKITFHYTALDGKLKELKLPIANIRQAERILAEGERVDGSSLFKGLVDTSLSDLYVVPVYKTAFLNPFDSTSLDFICRYLTHQGEPAPFALDNILQRSADCFNKSTGFELQALGELEFFLIHSPKTNIYTSIKQQGYHSAAPYVKSGQILDEMVRHITMITGAVKYAHSEVGYVESVRSNLEEIRGKQAEQIEIEFQLTPMVDAGDNLALARWLIRNIAYQYDCVATFAPKLEEGVAGNGMHVHMAVTADDNNIMVDDQGQLSPTARKAIGGLCHYADSLTAFGNTTSSAYLRLVPNQEAPTNICWSERNRSAMIRVPLGWSNVKTLGLELNPRDKQEYLDQEGRQTVELRSPDGSAIVYLLLAGITMA
ncbi:MAG: glutamine synthetase family protein, partial [Candidatus Neomarinimicrobiota bacterium]